MRQAMVWLAALLLLQGCTVTRFLGYKWSPDYPAFEDGQTIHLEGLNADVDLAVRPDGFYRIQAESEPDLARTIGYLMARDRMFQMDLFRHVARGELAALIGNVKLGDRTALQTDKYNRFLGHLDAAEQMVADLDPADREVLQAYSDGVNAWLAADRPSIEHRLLNTEVRPWEPVDTFAIFRLVMFGLTHNQTREMRRLLIACDTDLETLQLVWPTGIEFGPHILPDSELPDETHPIPPSIVPELTETWPAVCPPQEAAATGASKPIPTATVTRRIKHVAAAVVAFSSGIEASNNWVVSGDRTRSGAAIVANDPHLPLINPPIVWGAELHRDDIAAAGFFLPGIPTLVFGTNMDTAWGLTINNVDLQDLFIERPLSNDTYELDGEPIEFSRRTETFDIKDGERVTFTARFTQRGPVLNDLDPFLNRHAPIVSLRTLGTEQLGDVRAFRSLLRVTRATELYNKIQPMDSACLNWVFADQQGDIGWASPCRIPRRNGWLGDFPAPGWTSTYDWDGYYAKQDLPYSLNPEQGWLNTSNNRVLPIGRFPTPYDNDPSSPNRFVRVAEVIGAATAHTVQDSAQLQTDTKITFWSDIRKEIAPLCVQQPNRGPLVANVWIELCAWNGFMAADSIGATIYIYLANALADLTLGDRLSGGHQGELWHYIQNIPHYEANLDRLWREPVTAAVWDLPASTHNEHKPDAVVAAMDLAIKRMRARYGDDVQTWQWGNVRPFVIQHAFGSRGGSAAELFNAPSRPGLGAPNTVFKYQFLRSDREKMHPGAGAALHLIVEMNGPSGARYAMAGGQSGWPKSPHYADQINMWQNGKTFPLWTEAWPQAELQQITLEP